MTITDVSHPLYLFQSSLSQIRSFDSNVKIEHNAKRSESRTLLAIPKTKRTDAIIETIIRNAESITLPPRNISQIEMTNSLKFFEGVGLIGKSIFSSKEK
jgi:hypothetical protein